MTHSPTRSCCSRPGQKISTCPVKIRVNLKAEVARSEGGHCLHNALDSSSFMQTTHNPGPIGPCMAMCYTDNLRPVFEALK